MSAIKKIIEGTHGQFSSEPGQGTHTTTHKHGTSADSTAGSLDARTLREGDTTLGSTATTGDVNLDKKASGK